MFCIRLLTEDDIRARYEVDEVHFIPEVIITNHLLWLGCFNAKVPPHCNTPKCLILITA